MPRVLSSHPGLLRPGCYYRVVAVHRNTIIIALGSPPDMEFPVDVIKNAIAVTVPSPKLAKIAARKRSWEGYEVRR